MGVPPFRRQCVEGKVLRDCIPLAKVLNPLTKVEGVNMKLTAASETPRPSVDDSKSKDRREAEEESAADTVSKPGGFENDPDDPKNPNEVRERHLKKIKE
jgi:hypothetical protein